MKPKQGERTLLASVVLSAPGPLVVGLGLLLGHSSTQLADFVRRTAELGAIVVSWLVFRRVHAGEGADTARKARLEHTANACVGAAMCLSGVAMLFLALLSPRSQQGNVLPGLVIAVLGVTTNTWFWLRYRGLNRAKPDAILAVQSRLYRAKSLVDGCVTVALTVVALAPATPAARWVDMVGSVIVAAYLIVNGVLTLRKGSMPTLPSGPENAPEPAATETSQGQEPV